MEVFQKWNARTQGFIHWAAIPGASPLGKTWQPVPGRETARHGRQSRLRGSARSQGRAQRRVPNKLPRTQAGDCTVDAALITTARRLGLLPLPVWSVPRCEAQVWSPGLELALPARGFGTQRAKESPQGGSRSRGNLGGTALATP